MFENVYFDGRMDNVAMKVNELPWQKAGLSYTATGYGAKIPTRHMVRINDRWYRVYCTIYSNAGTCWVSKGGKKIIVSW